MPYRKWTVYTETQSVQNCKGHISHVQRVFLTIKLFYIFIYIFINIFLYFYFYFHKMIFILKIILDIYLHLVFITYHYHFVFLNTCTNNELNCICISFYIWIVLCFTYTCSVSLLLAWIICFQGTVTTASVTFWSERAPAISRALASENSIMISSIWYVHIRLNRITIKARDKLSNFDLLST